MANVNSPAPSADQFPSPTDSSESECEVLFDADRASPFCDGSVLHYLTFRLFWERIQPFLLFTLPQRTEPQQLTPVDSLGVNPSQHDALDSPSFEASPFCRLMQSPEEFPLELCQHVCLLLFGALLDEKFGADNDDTFSLHMFKLTHYPYYQRR